MDIVKALFQLDKSSGISGYLKESIRLVAEYFNFPLHGLISKDPSIPEMFGNIAERQFRALEAVVLKSQPGQVFVVNDTLPSPWGEIARIGFKSLIVIPIIHNNAFAGAFICPDRKRHDFTDKASYQLECVSFMISNAVALIRQKSETGKFELKLSNSLDPAAIITDENDVVTQANLEFVRLSGNNASDIIGSKWNSDQLQKDIIPLPILTQTDASKFPIAYEACLAREKIKVYCICNILSESPKKRYQHFVVPVAKQDETQKPIPESDADSNLARELMTGIDKIIKDSNQDRATNIVMSELGVKIGLDRMSLVKVKADHTASVGIQMTVEEQWASKPSLTNLDYNKQPVPMIVAKYASGVPVPANLDASNFGMKSMTIAPVFLSGKLWGFITAESLEQRNWSHESEKYLSLFAQFLAYHIENSKTIELLKADYDANRQMLLGYSTSIAIFSHKDNKFTDVSKGFSYISGWEKEEVIGKTTVDIDVYCIKDQRNEVYDLLAKNGRLVDKELLLKTKEGRVKNVLISAEIIAAKGQKYLVTSHKDITKIREIEQSLKRSEEQVKTIISSLPERILVIDEKGNIANIQNGLDFGDTSEPEQLLGRHFEELIPTDSRKNYNQAVESLKHDRKTKVFEFETNNSGKPKSFYEARLSITNSNEIVAIISNITENRLFRQNLDKAQDKFYNVFHFSPLGVVILDSNCQKILDCNNRFAKLVQTSIDQILGKNLTDVEILHTNTKIADFIDRLSTDKTYINFEIELADTKNNTAVCLFSGTKATIGLEDVYIVMISDISELKQARLDLVQSDVRFRTTVLNNNFPSMIANRETGEIILSNDDFGKMTGLQCEQISGESLISLGLVSKEKYESFLFDLEEYGTVKNRIDTYILRDGRPLNIIYSSEIIRFLGKDCILSTFQDITPLENANKAIHESEEKYRLLVENSPLGTLTIDFDGKILSVNRAMLGIIGQQDASVITNTSIFEHQIFTRSGIAEDFSYCCQTLEPYVSERTIRVNDSDLFLVIYSTPYTNKDGTHKRIQMILEDITITKMVEIELKKAISQAESASSAKSEFLANMSHEIRTPLNALLGFVQLMSSDIRDERQRQYISAIETAAQALNSMTASLLDISKIEAGKISIEYSAHDLAELIRDSILLTEHKSKESGNTIIFNFENQPSTYMIDPDRFKQIMINLLGNATKFTKDGKINVSLTINKGLGDCDSVIIEVDDTGIGIPKEMHDTVFEPFMQVDSSATRKFGGSGLGLAIVKGLVEKMNGTITIVDKDNPGTKFRIILTLEKAMSQTVKTIKPKDVVLWLDDEQTFDTFNDILSKTSLQISRHRSIPDNLKHVKLIITDHFDEKLASNAQTGTIPPIIFIGTQLSGKNWISIAKPVDRKTALVAISTLFPDEPELAFLNLIGKKILIVEDNPLNIMLLKDILTRMGCQTTVSMSGLEAVELIKQGGFDACLMDVQMPDLSGLDATMQVRYFEETTTRNRLPIIALTAYATNEDRDRCINAGMDDFVAKPFKMGGTAFNTDQGHSHVPS